MNFKWNLLFTLAIFTSSGSYAHEGHSIPGALPPAPHGGNVQEAAHLEEEHHEASGHEHSEGEEEKHSEGKEEVELFIEAVYANKKITIYPLAILPNDPKSFVELSPKKDLSNIKVKIEIPRTKAVIDLIPKVEPESMSVDFDAKKLNRFIVHVLVEHQKEEKLAKVQIENY
jgi:hypothetical protein